MFPQNPKISDSNAKNLIKFALTASISISGSLLFCTLLPFFWQLPFWANLFLFILCCLLFYFPIKKLVNIVFETLKKEKKEYLHLSIILLSSLLLTFSLVTPNLWNIIHLPAVTLNITFEPDAAQQNEIQLLVPEVLQNSENIPLIQTNNHQGCSITGNKIVLAQNQSCRLSYAVDVSRPSEIITNFTSPHHTVNAAINIRHIKETITLSANNQNVVAWKTDVAQPFSPKKIRYPLWVISTYFSIAILFLCFYAIGRKNIRLPVLPAKLPGNVFIYTCFAILSLLYASGRIGSYPWHFVNLYSDAANIASFAAAYSHPEYFVQDAFLSNPANFAGYFAFHVPLIGGLGSLFGNYATAFVVLLFPILFLTLSGYYLLGLSLFKNRGLSFIFSLLLFIPISLPVYEYYGANGDILPRSLFQALLPFALLLLLRVIERPKWWWLCSFVFLLLFYVHPVSGPSWFIALYICYLLIMLLHFHKIHWKPFITSLFVIIIGLLPFINAFFVPSEKTPLDIPLVKQILEYRLTIQTITVSQLYRQYLQSEVLPYSSMVFLWLVSIIFLLVISFLLIKKFFTKTTGLSEKQNQLPSMMIWAWWIAILFASIVIPLLDEIYINATGNLPILREIRRNLRYFLPLLWITFFYIIAKLLRWSANFQDKNLGKSTQTNLFLLSTVVFALYIFQEFPKNNIVFQNITNCFQQGKLICEVPGNSQQKVDFYDHVCEIVQPNQLIFPDPSPAYLGDSLIPRYYCMRSIAYTYKDGSGAGTSTMEFIENWWKLAKKMDEVLPTGETPLNLDVLKIAQSQNADYFIFIHPDSRNITELDENNIIYQNEYGLLYELP